MDSNQTRLLGILIIAIVTATGVMFALPYLQPADDTSTEYFVEIVGDGNESQNVTLDDMKNMDVVSGNSSFQNTYGNIGGEGLYKGVKVSDLIDLVGGMDDGFVIRVIAEDGYNQMFEKSKVYPNQTILDIQGHMILAFEYENQVVPDYEDGFRLAFLPEDGYYSNADANATTDPNPSAAGPQWVSNVIRIEVLENLYNSTLQLSETFLRTLPSISGEGGYLKTSGEIVGPFNFTGVRLSILVQLFDEVPEDYVIIGRAGDGHSVEYTKAIVEGDVNGYTPTKDSLESINSTMVIAYEEEGNPITEGGPLKIVFLNEDGNLTDGFRWLKDVESITIMELSQSTSMTDNDTVVSFEACIIKVEFIVNKIWL